MELYFLFLLFILMMFALGMGFPVAFALPGSAILSIFLASITGWILFDDVGAFSVKMAHLNGFQLVS